MTELLSERFNETMSVVQGDFWRKDAHRYQLVYNACWATLTNPSVLDYSSVTNQEELSGRLMKAKEFESAWRGGGRVLERPRKSFMRKNSAKQPSLSTPREREGRLKDFSKSIESPLRARNYYVARG